MEHWKRLDEAGFLDYSLSDLGRVRNDRTGRILRQSPNQFGTYNVGLIRTPGEGPVTLAVSYTVAQLFLDTPPRPFNSVIHLDGDRGNTRADNLMWRPRWFSAKYHKQFANPPYEFMRELLLVDRDEVYNNAREPAVIYGLLEQDIVESLTNRKEVWPSGFTFRLI